MFTGIIQKVVKIKKSERREDTLVLTIATPRGWKLKLGDSIATDGVCLTVTKIGRGWYQTELMEETLERTTFGHHVPDKVNLERSLRPIDFLDGHMVQGHVDCVGEIVKVKGERLKVKSTTERRSLLYAIRFPKKYSKLIVEKCSIAMDGISMTVVDARRDWFSVALIPFTLTHTTIGAKEVGDLVNLEFDVIAKYVKRLLVD